MSVTLNPYLSFRGNAREAIEFYRSVFGGELISNTFLEAGVGVPESEKDQLMHSQLTTPNGLTLMASDVPSSMDFTPGASIRISLSGDDDERLTGYWKGLSEGAKVEEELQKAPWGDSFGMLVDRFGVGWMVNIAGSTA